MKDKLWHFGISVLLAIIFAIILGVICSLVIVISIGIIKELWDKFIEDETFDLYDLTADIAGTIFGLWLITLIYHELTQ